MDQRGDQRGPVRATAGAWLVRANVRGRDRLPRWLDEGYVAIGWYEAGPVHPGTPREELSRRVAGVYPDRSPGSVRNAVGNIYRFVNGIVVGDLVAVPDGSEIFLAEVTSGAVHVRGSEEAHRREVRWLAPESPLLRHELSGAAQAKMRTMLTVTDLGPVGDELRAAQRGLTD